MNTALSSIGDRLWDATQTVGDFLSGGKTAEIRGEKVAKSIGLGKEEVQKRAELSADDFLPLSAVLSANRNSLASQRNTEVNRLLTLPKTDAKTGAGTLAAFSSSAGQASVKLPEEIPQSPTAFQLAKQLSNQQVVEELLNSGIVESRKGGVAKSAMRGINRGVTLGIVGQRDMESPYTQAQLQQEPMTSGQQNAEIAGELAGSFVPYAGIAKVVGSSFRTVSAINRFATKNPFLFGATVSNLGEELVDMGVRKGTGQEYNQNDFILGMAMGGAFEGVFAGVRSMKNARLIQAQLNTAASQLKEATPKALYEAVKNQRVDGLDITYESLFKEHRLAFYRQAGREGIDRPSRPPNPDDVKPLSEYNPENAMDTLTLQKTADQLGTTTEKLREVVEEAGSDVNDIGAALQKNFPKYDELMAQIQKGIDDGDLPIGAVDIADPLRKSVFGRTVNGVAPKATGLIGGGDSVKIDQGTMLPNEIGEQRMPGLKGDENLKLQKEEILPEQVKVFTKPVRTESDIEIMFEPTMRGHLADFVNKTLNSRYISSFGNEGKAIAGMIDKADEIANIKIGIDVDELSPIMRGMNEVEIARFPDIAEGKIMPETPKEIALFDFWSTRRAEIAEQAQRSGLTVRGTDGIDRPFVPRDNYYPRVVNEARLKEIRSNPEKANAMFISMMEKSNGAIESITEAKKIFNNIIKDRTQKRYGNLERAREVDFLPDDMLIRDPRKVLSSYLQGARKRIADAQTLGPKQENAIRLIEDARVRGGDADTMLELLRRATGEEIFNQGEVQLSRIARTYNNFSKLSLAAVTNMGDVVKPFVRSGEFFTTLKGIVKSFTEEGATQARRSGAVEANLRSLLEDAGDTKWSDAFFKYTGFTMTETKVRSFNANAAVAHAEALVKRLSRNPDNAFAYRRLAQWLEDPDAAIKRGFLTQAEKDVVGFRGIADTQPLRRLDIPFYWQRPGVKVLTQFKTFAYKHMTFMKKFVVDEARQGNVRPLIAFLVMGQIVGETVGDMKAAIRNRDRPDDVTRRIIDNYMTIGGIGLATDFLSNLQYGSLGGGFLKFVAGPTLTDVDDWLTRIVSKNRAERIPKKVVGMVPLIGPAAAQTLYPSKNTYNARTIPIAEDILQLLEPSSSTSGRSSNASSRLPSRRSSTRLNPYR